MESTGEEGRVAQDQALRRFTPRGADVFGRRYALSVCANVRDAEPERQFPRYSATESEGEFSEFRGGCHGAWPEAID